MSPEELGQTERSGRKGRADHIDGRETAISDVHVSNGDSSDRKVRRRWGTANVRLRSSLQTRDSKNERKKLSQPTDTGDMNRGLGQKPKWCQESEG